MPVRVPHRLTVVARSGAILLLLGAMAARGDPAPQTVTVALGPTTTRFTFIEGRDAARALGERRPAPVEPESASERQLVAYCSNGEPQRAAAEKGLMTDLLSAAVGLVLDKAAERIRAELARYSAVSEQTSRIDYYRGGAGAAGGVRLESRYACLRFTRLMGDPNAGAEIALDFVASIGMDTDGSAVLLRPLRLYVSKSVARSATGRYGVAIMLRAEAVWRDAIVGHQGVVFDQTIASEAVDLTTKPFLTYYAPEPGTGLRLPIVPLSVDSDRSRDFGRADFTITVAETGVQPASLALLAQFLPTTTDRRTRLLLQAATVVSQGIP
jgi:hypothetical protein